MRVLSLSIACIIAIAGGVAAEGDVTFSVFADASGTCTDATLYAATLMDPQAQEVGHCQNHGMGANYYNAFEVLGCSDRCLCVKQVADSSPDTNCNSDVAIGGNIKMSCFGRCLVDCNGPTCGETETNSVTRLMLTGSGPICADPVPEEEFVCEHTGMVLDDNGEVIDTMVTPLEALRVPPGTMGSGGSSPPGVTGGGVAEGGNRPDETGGGEEPDEETSPAVDEVDDPGKDVRSGASGNALAAGTAAVFITFAFVL